MNGFFWLVADHSVAYEWAQAGGVRTVHPMGMWWTAIPREPRTRSAGERPDERPDLHLRYGDRHDRLVFIGRQMDEPSLRARLDACLLDGEVGTGASSEWSGLSNPFPAPQMVGEEGA